MKLIIENLNNINNDIINIMSQKLCEYVCGVDNEVLEKYPLETPEKLRAKLESVLGDSRGWRKYGYTFKCIGEIGVNVNKIPNHVLKIILVTWEKAKRECGSKLGGFSCYGSSENTIFINLDNWMGKSKSELPLDRYRTYVINHEMGHRLGFGHPEKQKKQYCSANHGAKGSVMIQMTRGPDFVAPCIENEWPLDPHEYDETKNPHLYTKYPITGGGESFIGGISTNVAVNAAAIASISLLKIHIFAVIILIAVLIIAMMNFSLGDIAPFGLFKKSEQMMPYHRALMSSYADSDFVAL